ncbi:MAG: hypothetical protein ACETWG_11605 [Candidatus Neomarinimicrobiota bacterium]
MRPVITGTILGVLFALASGLVWLLAGRPNAVAVFAGGILPIAISAGSLFVFFVLKTQPDQQRRYQRFVVTNFLVKVVLIGLWTAAILLATALPPGPFVGSLLVNFFIWHLFEAYRYQAALGAVAVRLGRGGSS